MRLSNHHQKNKLLPSKLRATRSGFVMIEVIMGILIMTLFIGIAMQFMVFSSLLKARAQQYSESMAWIQQDLEEIKYQASKYKSSSLSDTTAAINSSTIVLSSAHDFQVDDKLKIGTDSTTYTIGSISGNTLTISPNLAVASPASAPVVTTESIRCNKTATPATITTGFADGFRDRIIGSDSSATSSDIDTTKTSTRNGKQFRLRKTISIVNVAPYNTLQIDYRVAEIYGSAAFGISIADTYAEVVPPTSFSCSE